MGLWTDYTKKDTPEDNDTLMLYDAAGKENKQTLFSGFWKWVAKKLKEATLSDLETTNKTMIGAINELNSNRFGLDPYRNIDIKSNTDLNTVVVSGSYFIRDSTTSATIKNSPYENQGYCLYVIAFSKSIVKQAAIPTVANEFKIRTLWNGSWNTWVTK